MSKVIIPDALKGKALFEFLMANKSALIAQKKSMLKRCEPIACNPTYLFDSPTSSNKAEGDGAAGAPMDDTGVLRVKAVANTAYWCDSQMDVLLPDNAKKSIKERKGLIPHIHDHIWEMGAKVGEVVNIYYQDMLLTDLGINKSGSTQALIFETDIMKEYNEKVYLQYKRKKANQHSIGLQYVKIELAINDSEYEKEMDFWNKYVDLIINKEVVMERGYFWVVSEIKLMENSVVLFGSNILTPTLSEEQKTDGNDTQPPMSTGSNPQKSAIEDEVKWDKIAEKLFQ